MKKINFVYFMLVMLVYMFGFLSCLLLQPVQASNPKPSVTNVQETQMVGVSHDIIYIGNKRYVVFKYNSDIEVMEYD